MEQSPGMEFYLFKTALSSILSIYLRTKLEFGCDNRINWQKQLLSVYVLKYHSVFQPDLWIIKLSSHNFVLSFFGPQS